MKLKIAILLLAVSFIAASCNKTPAPQDNTPYVQGSLSPLASDSARQVFDKFTRTHKEQDLESYKHFLTAKNLDAVLEAEKNSEHIGLAKSIEFISERSEGDSEIFHGRLTSQTDQQREFDFVFVKENGVWKYDQAGSLARLK